MVACRDAVSHVCVFGVGGVGGYFGGKLAWGLADQGDTEWETHFVARGQHLAEIRRRGLILDTTDGRLVCKPTSAVQSLGEMPTPDIVLLCVKSYDLEEAVCQIAAHCSDRTVLVPLLNGIDIYPRVRAILQTGFVLPACAFVGTHVRKPGVVEQRGGDGFVLLGPDPDHSGFVPERVLDLFRRVGIRYQWFDDPRLALWEKYLFISAFGLATAASGKTLGALLVDADLMDDVRGVMDEIVRIAQYEGVDLGPDAVPDALAKASGFPLETKTSYQRDIEAGRRDEGDLFGATIIRLGRQHGTLTPHTERLFARVCHRSRLGNMTA